MKSKKLDIIIYVLLNILTTIFLIKELIDTNIKNVMICLSCLIVYLLPYLVEKKFKLKIPTILKVSIFLFSFSSEILGEVNNFYDIIPFWDAILHTVNGFLSASIGFSLIQLLNKKIRLNLLSPLFILLFSFCFSMVVGITWEILEYSSDCIFKTDMQTDMYITSVKSELLDSGLHAKVINVDKIDYTIIYNKYNEKIVRLDKYLDIGLHDTMKDIIVNVVGAAVFCGFIYLYLINKSKYKFVEKLMIKGVITNEKDN